MQQLSRPYQIALGALLVFAIAWFTVLKPSDTVADETPLPTVSPAAALPGATGPSAVAKANGAAAASNAASAAAGADPAATPSTGTTPAPALVRTPKAKPAVKPASRARSTDPSLAILRDVARGKVAVLLFSERAAVDDRAVRRALARVDRHGGKVVVRMVPIARVARYRVLTKAVEVMQSPTVLVIGKGNRVRTLVGVADTLAFDQLISDVGGAGFRLRR